MDAPEGEQTEAQTGETGSSDSDSMDESDEDDDDGEALLIKQYVEQLAKIDEDKFNYDNYVQLLEIAQ